MAVVPRQVNRLGWIPDLPDARDYKLADTLAKKKPKPKPKPPTPTPTPTPQPSTVVDLRPLMPPVVDQGQLGSCTANAIAGAYDYELARQQKPYIYPSRLDIYYDERVIEGTVKTDAGAMIRDGIKVIATQGVFPESAWPYDTTKYRTKPPAKSDATGAYHLATTYYSVATDQGSVQQALNNNYAIIIGFTVYDSFKNINGNGVMLMPDLSKESVLGGHAVVICGNRTIANQPYWIVRNSWGTAWGDNGYFYMPVAYTQAGYGNDFWALEVVSG